MQKLFLKKVLIVFPFMKSDVNQVQDMSSPSSIIADRSNLNALPFASSVSFIFHQDSTVYTPVLLDLSLFFKIATWGEYSYHDAI